MTGFPMPEITEATFGGGEMLVTTPGGLGPFDPPPAPVPVPPPLPPPPPPPVPLPPVPVISIVLVVVVTPLMLVEVEDDRVQPGHSMPRIWPAVTRSIWASLRRVDAAARPAATGKAARVQSKVLIFIGCLHKCAPAGSTPPRRPFMPAVPGARDGPPNRS